MGSIRNSHFNGVFRWQVFEIQAEEIGLEFAEDFSQGAHFLLALGMFHLSIDEFAILQPEVLIDLYFDIGFNENAIMNY